MTKPAMQLTAPEGAELHRESGLPLLARDTLRVAAGEAVVVRDAHLVAGRLEMEPGAVLYLEAGAGLHVDALVAGPAAGARAAGAEREASGSLDAPPTLIVAGSSGASGSPGARGAAGSPGSPGWPGTNGGTGGTGGGGQPGLNAPQATFNLGVVTGTVLVIARGGNGGAGGAGGDGGPGGAGTAGGNGGPGGPGGAGADAGSGSTVVIYYRDGGARFITDTTPGQGGRGGPGGNGGAGGGGNPPGVPGQTGPWGPAGRNGTRSTVTYQRQD